MDIEMAKYIVDIFPSDLRLHSYNVCYLSARLAEYMGYSRKSIQELAIGALLHDIGKTRIEKELLNKPGRLTEEEFSIIKKHTVIGSELIKSIKGYQNILPIILYHHERWDGNGYERLKGNEIPETAQIVTIADAFDAMTTKRPYQKVKTLIETLHDLNRNKGSQFSPEIVEKFQACILEHSKKATGYLQYISPFT
ncbi:HD-GYP domain [Desulfocucumis palustris]|uniref:HD-GYP domain n=1 Tax=Desulfocucumis palustris TaxID=1898651 RepID=A0A2L2XAE5_9FIRM|nr:HD-GYP domain-containing protein [Desulfocucumis palustris]GBF32613.1 HD-GYP domain [Desulfocucumis palustris]